MLKGFRDFVLRGNVVDLAVAVVIGTAFTSVVTAFTSAFLKPLIGLFLGGGIDAGRVRVNGQVFDFPLFINALITFVITAMVIYFFVVLPITKIMAHFKTEPDVSAPTRDCPECLSSIPVGASRCAFCTAAVTPVAHSEA